MRTDMRKWLFFGSFVRLHILYWATKKPICGAEILAGLDCHEYRLNARKVTDVLRTLEQEGYLNACTMIVSGKRWNYYEATRKTRQVMEVARKRLLVLAAELLG